MNRVCPAWLASQKDDIVQTALVRAFETSRKSEPRADPPPSYWWKVAYTATVDQMRRVRQERNISLEQAGEEGMLTATDSGPFQDLSHQDLGLAVQGCLPRLNPRRRLVVGLYLMGHTLPEMMRLTGWDNRKTRNLLCRGLDDLRRQLGKQGFSR